MKHILSIFMCFALGRVAPAQTPAVEEHDAMLRYGVNASLDANLHSADFQTLPGIPSCCTGFTGGSGFGPSLGIFAEKPFSKTLALALRASYMSSDGLLSVDEPTQVNIGNVAVDGTFRHSLDAKLSSIGLEPLLVTRLFGGLALEVGARAALALTATYSQKEEIVSPANSGVFVENGMRTRNVYAGAIPNAATFGVGLLGGVRYELPMNASRTLLLAPEVMYVYAVTPVATGLAWHANTIRAGVSLVFAPAAAEPRKETAPPPPVIPPPPPVVETKPLRDTSLMHEGEDKNGRKSRRDDDRSPFREALRLAHLNGKPALSAMLATSGVETDGVESPLITLRVEEFVSTAMRPLLPYVFFDQNASTIPARYDTVAASGRNAFKIDKLFALETLPMYYQVLNIVGRRLADAPRTTVTLTGCNDDRTTEKGNRKLSQSRAETVRNYLRDTWGVAEGRMTIASRDLPSSPSNPDSLDGMAENRRVEISSDSWEIMAPVILNDTLVTATPPIVRFRDTTLAEGGERLWTLGAAQRSKQLRSYNGDGTPPTIIDWNLNDNPATIPRAPIPMDAELNIEDSTGQQYTATALPLPVNQVTLLHKRETRVADHTVDKYSLILFDFDQADIGATNKKLCGIIREHIDPTSTVHVDGFSDRTGDSTHNFELSRSRAVNVAQSVAPGRAASAGQHNLLFSNDTPEGRCYSRTVNVTVETPLKP